MADFGVSAVIPAFNEEGAVASIVGGLRQVLGGRVKAFEVIVVDDGSTDATARRAAEAGARVIRHPANRGYGQTLLTGIAAASHDWILMIDADGSYPTAEAARLLPYAPAYDLVIGARTGAHFWGSTSKAFLRWVYLNMASFIVGETLPDANSGLRLVRKSMVTSTGPVQCLGYSFTTTMTLSFLQAGRFVAFVPIEFQAREGSSKVRPLRDILRTLQLMTQVMLAFNPLKLFVTLGAAAMAMAFFLAFLYVISVNTAWLICSALAATAAVQCFIAGCVVDSIRIHCGRTPPTVSRQN